MAATDYPTYSPAPARGCPVAHHGYEPFDQSDPFAAYAGLRRHEPVFLDERTGYFVVSRYEDVRAVFADWRTFSSENAQCPVTPRSASAQRVLWDGGFTAYSGLSARVPPDHTRIRDAAAVAFTPHRYRALEPTIHAHVERLLTPLVSTPGRRADLVPAFTSTLPVLVLLSLMGVRTEHAVTSFKRWSASRSALTWAHLTDDEQVPHAHHLVEYWHACLDLVLGAHTGEHQDSLIGDLVRGQGSPDSLTDHEIASLCYSLLFAGHETTTALLGNAVLMLLSHREQWERLVADPSLAMGAVDETLRMSPPIVAWRRLATRDAVVAGTRVPAWSEVLVLMGAANRDPSRFGEPETFDIGRPDAGEHLSWGFGIHHCLGAELARQQCAIALRHLAAALPTLRLDGSLADVEYPDSLSMRVPSAVPVAW
ncbi:cytochrome P450 [Lentzea sp. NPDC058436]|uniref:cytochrome P450 n=1 Tax=Lentzea sp. NPDC058436 TaxID=3346499 RepID=UPI003661A54F